MNHCTSNEPRRNRKTNTKEGKYTLDMGFAKSEGTFKISDDGKNLITKEVRDGKDGKEETMGILTLTADKFVSTQKDPSGKEVTMTLVPAKD